MTSIWGLQSEKESLEERLEQAEKDNDSDKASYLTERIRRVDNDIQGKKDYQSYYGKKK